MTVILFSAINTVDGGNAIDEAGTVEENNAETESTFKQVTGVFLRQEFVHSQQINYKMVQDAKKDLRGRLQQENQSSKRQRGRLSLN